MNQRVTTPSQEARQRPAAPCLAMRAQKAADALDVSLSTFLTWVREGKMPKPIKVGAVALYDAEAVHSAWEALKATSEGGDGNPFDE